MAGIGWWGLSIFSVTGVSGPGRGSGRVLPGRAGPVWLAGKGTHRPDTAIPYPPPDGPVYGRASCIHLGWIRYTLTPIRFIPTGRILPSG